MKCKNEKNTKKIDFKKINSHIKRGLTKQRAEGAREGHRSQNRRIYETIPSPDRTRDEERGGSRDAGGNSAGMQMPRRLRNEEMRMTAEIR